MKHLKTTLILVALLAISVPALAGSHPHERDGFVIGFNIGGGSANFTPDAGEKSDGGGGAGTFRLGWAFSNQFLVGFESPAWIGNTNLNADLDLFSYLLNFTWYPGAKGWFLRAGFGGGTATVSTTILNTRVSAEDSGGSFGFGAGHEWRLTQKFALGVAVDFNTIDLDYGKFDFANFTAQLNWYF